MGFVENGIQIYRRGIPHVERAQGRVLVRFIAPVWVFRPTGGIVPTSLCSRGQFSVKVSLLLLCVWWVDVGSICSLVVLKIRLWTRSTVRYRVVVNMSRLKVQMSVLELVLKEIAYAVAVG